MEVYYDFNLGEVKLCMTARTVLEQYQVADFIEWHDKKQLRLNPDFQRRRVWTPDGKSYLIDTILRGLPMPKVYLRSIIDVKSQRSIRDVVDGQQRLAAILDFARGDLQLNKRAGEFQGKTYADLDEGQKTDFLSYRIGVDQLVNATEEDVLQIFARLNSYTVPLNPQEIRHAKYQGDFKWKVREVATSLSDFWKNYEILSLRDRVRMADDQLTAEMFGVLLEGIKDGGKPQIDKLYEFYDEEFPNGDEVGNRVEQVIADIQARLDDVLKTEIFVRPPQFLILFAAMAHLDSGIPKGDLGAELPKRPNPKTIKWDGAKGRLTTLAEAYYQVPPTKKYADFVRASTASTQRISSRRTRFRYVWQAITGE